MKKQALADTQAVLDLADQHMIREPDREQPSGETLVQTVTMSVLEIKKREAMALTVAKDGLDAVKEALKNAGLLRRTAEAEHAAIKRPHLERCQELDKQKRELLAYWAPVEKHLTDEVNAEELAAERKAQALKAEIVKTRQAKLQEIGAPLMNTAILGDMNEIEFDLELTRQKGVQEQLAKARELEAENAKLRQQVASQPAKTDPICDRCKAPMVGGWECQCDPLGMAEGPDEEERKYYETTMPRGQCGPLPGGAPGGGSSSTPQPSGFSKTGGFARQESLPVRTSTQHHPERPFGFAPSATVTMAYANPDEGYRQLVDIILGLPIPPGPKADDVQDVIDRICGEILAIAKR